MKKNYLKTHLSKILPRLCSPVSAPPPNPLMGLSYGEQSLCRVPPSPVHPHEETPMRSCCNFFIFEAKSLICSLVGAFLLLSRGVPRFGAKFVFVLVLSSCYSWYQLTWNSLQLEFSVNDRFKAWFHLKVVFTSLNVAFVPISRSRFKQRQIPPLRTFTNVLKFCVNFWVIFGHFANMKRWRFDGLGKLKF